MMLRSALALVLLVSAGAALAAYPSLTTGSTGAIVTTTTTAPPPAQTNGTLSVGLSVGPIMPVCRANSTTGPDPSLSQVSLVITSQSGQSRVVPLNWFSDGCNAFASDRLPLPPGAYVLNLTPCSFMGCGASLPRGFTIVEGRVTTVNVTIDTGIR